MSEIKPKLGKVFIGQKQKRGVAGDRAVRREDSRSIDVTSGSGVILSTPADRIAVKTISPKVVGPVLDKQSGLWAETMEDAWQGGKLWKSAGHIGADGQPTPEWFAFRAKVYASGKGKRRPLSKKRYGLPSSSFYEGRLMGYVESRKRIYVPKYAECIENMSAMHALRAELAQGVNLLILDNDAPPKDKWPQGREMTQEMWNEMIEDASVPFGHGYVVAALLQGGIRIDSRTD